MQARYAILSDLPIPSDLPSGSLIPILIPTSFTLQDFLATITGVRAFILHSCMLQLAFNVGSSRYAYSKRVMLRFTPCKRIFSPALPTTAFSKRKQPAGAPTGKSTVTTSHPSLNATPTLELSLHTAGTLSIWTARLTDPRVRVPSPRQFFFPSNLLTECFFNKEGKWYYAGVYKTFRLRDIAPQ